MVAVAAFKTKSSMAYAGWSQNPSATKANWARSRGFALCSTSIYGWNSEKGYGKGGKQRALPTFPQPRLRMLLMLWPRNYASTYVALGI
jgi:hypothetical protein